MEPLEFAQHFYKLVMLPLGKSVQAWVADWDGTFRPDRAMEINRRFFARAEDLQRATGVPEDFQQPPEKQAQFEAEVKRLCAQSGLRERTWDFIAMNGGPAMGGLPEIKVDKTVPPEDLELIERVVARGGDKLVIAARLAHPAGEVAFTWTRPEGMPQCMVLQSVGSPTRRCYIKAGEAWEKALDYDGGLLTGQGNN